jgi:tetratricopeptide (TPR) repeat protein
MSTGSARGTAAIAIPLALLLFVAVGVGRLDQVCGLEPDCADYVLMARTLATTGEYRAAYDPTGVPFAWRPPGLPLLLIPAARLRPYDVAAAKAVVLACGAILLGLFWCSARRSAGPAGALAAFALMATSPYTLLWSTEVLSEVPFVASLLAIILLVGGRGANESRARWIGVSALLGLLPLLRAVGLAMWLACWLWAVRSRRRRALIPLALAALVPYTLWAWRNAQSGQSNYVSFLRQQLAGWTLRENLAQSVRATLLDYGYLVGMLVPGGSPGRPTYALSTRFPALLPMAAWPLVVVVAVALLALCGLGLWVRRRDGGSLVVLFILLYLPGVALWPSRHERLLWPLVPLLLTFLPAGLRRLVDHLEGRSPSAAAGFLALGGAAWAALVGWQLYLCAGMTWTSLECRRDPDRLSYRSPPLYFADWQSAGRWLRANTRPDERVVTAHTDLACTGRRFQGWMLGGEGLTEKIRNLPARYLVLASGLHGSNLPEWVFTGDPVYSVRRVYDHRDVAIFEIRPNREGTVAPSGHGREAALAACEASLAEAPWRLDLGFARAMLLEAAGRRAAATEELRGLARRGRADGATFFHLALFSLEADRYAEAIQSIDQAFAQPEVELMADSLVRMRAVAQSGLEGTRPRTPSGRVAHARWLAKQGRFRDARSMFDALVGSHPDDPLGHFARGEFFQRLGQVAEARRDFQAASDRGYPEAAEKLRLLAWADALEGRGPARFVVGGEAVELDPGRPQAYAEFAAMLRRDGTPGKALDVLEGAVARSGDLPALILPLADLYRSYAFPEQAQALYRKVLDVDPRNIEARSGLEQTGYLLSTPQYK